MIELAAGEESGLYALGFAGNSFNTAIYLARAGLDVSYLTRLGDDALSRDIVATLTDENVGTDRVQYSKDRQPGLYLISNDADGERHFSYWRDTAPVRELFDAPVSLNDADVFYFTGITLAVTRSGQTHLLQLLDALRARNCRIVFDPNFRPRLWDGIEQAREHTRAILPFCHTVLPTLDDERELWNVAGVDDCRALYADLGVEEIVIKGDDLTTHFFAAREEYMQAAAPVHALDTTGAGDSFNAGYLTARLQGANARDAITQAQELSAAVVQHRGAILPRNQGSKN
ncbi:MAG: sugar kinase [Halioglobus sp.]|nr:sugar kinase [Halioglobus sp.]